MVTIEKYEPPTKEEEQGMTPNELVEANIPYAIERAMVFWGRHKGKARAVTSEDVVSSAFEGLVEASHRFDKERGYKFISYARHWIDQKARSCIEKDSVTHIPLNRLDDFYKLHQTMTDNNLETIQEAGEALEWNDRRVELAILTQQTPARMKRDEGLDDGAEEISVSPDLYDGKGEAVQKMLANLTTREAQVVHMYFFYNSTLEEVGNALGFTRERARQIKDVALTKLRMRYGRIARELLGDEHEPRTYGHHTVVEVP